MDFSSARQAILRVLRGARAEDVPRLLRWMRTSSDFEEFTSNNDDVILRSIAEDLRLSLPTDAILNSEHLPLQKLQEQTKPTVHIDAFLYDDDYIDSLCERGKMSRNYCLTCGSHQTAPLEFISHSFSLMEVKFLYQHVLPDLTGKVLVDVGSRLGVVLFGGYFYSSASQLYGVEINADFCQLQEAITAKYQLCDRVKVVNADICTQASLLQNADVVIMNNVFEYFLDRSEQARCWEFIYQNVRKKGSLLVTIPSLEKSFSDLQIIPQLGEGSRHILRETIANLVLPVGTNIYRVVHMREEDPVRDLDPNNVNIQLNQWVEAVPLDYDVFLEVDADREALEEIYLYKIL
ncbi:uncharacterized protein LOC121924639 isoform X2 [Sceloporus undulatus]|uniref:uncharacterized protein LOC121924639 isoform X2 n=1 Tax=Sceloporus undulatus TaxID=8520 RepID=UPI001C4C3813|nr:uncharacterized protein LOC121924639 isoform X2 [Sceloporus undulatus]